MYIRLSHLSGEFRNNDEWPTQKQLCFCVIHLREYDMLADNCWFASACARNQARLLNDMEMMYIRAV